MNENYNYSYEDEAEINLIDLMFYLLKQWKTLIAAILIGAVIGGGIYVVKKSSADKAAAALEAEMEEAKTGVEDDETVEELKGQYQITEDVESNMELAYQYRQLYRKQLEYNQNSPIMTMNPSAVYSGELEYYVSAEYDTGMIALLYQNILNDSGILEELKETADLPYKEQYIRELVSCSVSRENDSSVNINSDVQNVYRTAIITFTVSAPSEEECEQMLQVIRGKAAEIDQQCLEAYEDYSMTLVNDSINLVASSDYLSRQKTNTDQLNTYRNTMANLENSFTEEEKAYYNRVYLSRDYEVETETEETEAAADTAVVEPESVSLVKWLVIGVFLMCVVWGGYYLVKYLLDKKIKTPDELRSRYGLPLIGYVKTDTDARKGLDGWLDQMRSKSWGAGDTTENIGSMITAMELPDLLLCVEGGGKKLEDVAAVVCECVKGLKRSASLSGDGSLIAEAKESDGIILAVEIGGTAYAQIERELEISRMQNVKVKGVIVVA